jgi:hypothetical protein
MPKCKPLPPLSRVKELVRYDASSGKLFWLKSVARWIKPGDEAGTKVKNATDITLDKITYRAHRIIWLLMTEQGPGHEIIDHIDGNPHNNKFENLRLATHHQNQCNQKRRSDNTSGLKGVSWSEERKKWQAGISVKGKRIALGRFNTKEEAYLAYCKAAKKMHENFARLQ